MNAVQLRCRWDLTFRLLELRGRCLYIFIFHLWTEKERDVTIHRRPLMSTPVSPVIIGEDVTPWKKIQWSTPADAVLHQGLELSLGGLLRREDEQLRYLVLPSYCDLQFLTDHEENWIRRRDKLNDHLLPQ